MGSLLETILLGVLYFLPLVFWFVYKHHTRQYDYWKKRGVPYKEPSFPFGSLKDYVLRKKHTGQAYDEAYNQFPKERLFGLVEINKPSLVVRDPDLVKQILVKDFHHFADRTPLVKLPRHSLANGLPIMSGKEWKEMRHKLTPTFTSGKMKMMFNLIEKCGEQLKEYLEKVTENGKTINAKDMLNRFTMDIIASCAFGLDTNNLAGDSEFINNLSGMMILARPSSFQQISAMVMPPFFKKFLATRVLAQSQTTKFLGKVVKDTVEYRENNNVTRNDFLDLLIKIKHNKSLDDKVENMNTKNGSDSATGPGLTMDEMIAQASVFFIAGFETSASLMSFCLYELSRHQDVQDTLHHEIQKAVNRTGDKITYQTLTEIPYLDQVINETLRLYGTAPILTRTCTQPYRVPGSDLVLEKDQRVVIPAYSFHHDPQYFPDPYKFDPERFTPENSKNRHPYVFLPFGEGPRNCIGMRFGQLQAKMGLATIILSFRVHLAPEQEVPITLSQRSIVTQPKNPVWVTFQRRNNVAQA